MKAILINDSITPELQRILLASRRPVVLWQAGAKSVQKMISDHLRKLQARGNVKGWPSQKFFAGKPTSVEKSVGIEKISATGATITIADPRFAHRIEGGVVTAKRKKFLAIPLTAAAYAKSGKGSIRESMPGLFVVKFPRGLYLCKEVGTKTRAGATGKRQFNAVKSLRLLPMFKLVRSVTHKPHPQDLPNPVLLSAAARAGMTKAAEILFKAGR